MVDRVLIGKRPSDGVTGMWITKPGLDLSSTNPDDFLFDPSKYMARAYARLVTSTFTRGELLRTITYSDGTKSDGYAWYSTMNVGLPYVPIIISQLGNEAAIGSIFNGETYYKNDQIVVKTGDLHLYRYNAGDASKTPIVGGGSGPTGSTGRWGFDWTQSYITYIEGNNSNFIIYRNPLF